MAMEMGVLYPLSTLDLGKLDNSHSEYKFNNLYLAGNLSDGTNSISIANIASKSEIPDVTHMVTDNTAQTISADKTIASGSKLIAASSLWDYYLRTNSSSALYLGSNSNGNSSQGDAGIWVQKSSTASTCIVELGAYGEGITLSNTTLNPWHNNKTDLGTSSKKYKDLYLAGVLSDGTNSIAIANIANVNDLHSLAVSTSIDPSGATGIGAIKVDNNKYNIYANKIDWTHVPTTDPQVAGQIWNDNGIVKISSGQ